MRDLDATQSALLAQRETRPIYLIVIDAAGQEYLSTSGTHSIDDIPYTPGDVGLRAVTDWSEATITLRPTPARVERAIGGEWRRGSCDIYLLPATRYPLIYEDGYVEDGYAMQGDTYGDPILLLPGAMSAARVTDRGVEYRVVHRARTARWSPPIRVAPPAFNHLPRPGTIITWGGERFVLEAR